MCCAAYLEVAVILTNQVTAEVTAGGVICASVLGSKKNRVFHYFCLVFASRPTPRDVLFGGFLKPVGLTCLPEETFSFRADDEQTSGGRRYVIYARRATAQAHWRPRARTRCPDPPLLAEGRGRDTYRQGARGTPRVKRILSRRAHYREVKILTTYQVVWRLTCKASISKVLFFASEGPRGRQSAA